MADRKTKRDKPKLSLMRDERGLTTVEYIIILCLIAMVGFAVWKKFGATVKEKVDKADGTVDTMEWEGGGGGGGGGGG